MMATTIDEKKDKIIDLIKEKVEQLKNDLEANQVHISHCEMWLNKEIHLHSNAEAIIDHLNRYNANLECKLKEGQHEVHEARDTIRENESKRNALEQQLQLQAEKIELLEMQLINLKHQVKDADRNAQQSVKRVNQLTDRLTFSEKQLEESRIKNVQLEGELRADAQNLRCVERAFERSSRQVLIADGRIAQFELRLLESERRANQAELQIEQFQKKYENLEKDIEKLWLCVLRKLETHINSSH